jgi:snapalysin
MSSRKLNRLLATLATAALAMAGVTVGTAAPAAAEEVNIATICYSTASAGPYASTAVQAAGIWNDRTANINWSQCGTNVRIYYTTGGGSYAVTYSLGNGYIVIDTQQAAQYSPLRIMTHEMGHLLGLPDNYNGNCAILMSGGSAGTSCTNPYPSSGEAGQVDYNFRNYLAGTGESTGTQIFQDSWPAPVGVGLN